VPIYDPNHPDGLPLQNETGQEVMEVDFVAQLRADAAARRGGSV
jgi:hypothetical protein